MYMYVICVCVCSSAIKKENLPFVATMMNLEDIMLSEVSQKGKNPTCLAAVPELVGASSYS